CQRSTGCVIGARERRGLAGGVHQLPGEVVVRPGRVADAPMGHGTVGVGRQRLLEAGDSLLMVKAEAPVEAPVEPALGLRRGGGHLPRIGAEIIGVVHVASSAICDASARGPTFLAFVARNIGWYAREPKSPTSQPIFLGWATVSAAQTELYLSPALLQRFLCWLWRVP